MTGAIGGRQKGFMLFHTSAVQHSRPAGPEAQQWEELAMWVCYSREETLARWQQLNICWKQNEHHSHLMLNSHPIYWGRRWKDCSFMPFSIFKFNSNDLKKPDLFASFISLVFKVMFTRSLGDAVGYGVATWLHFHLVWLTFTLHIAKQAKPSEQSNRLLVYWTKQAGGVCFESTWVGHNHLTIYLHGSTSLHKTFPFPLF